MRYLQAVVESETQKRLFKKDFQVQKIFTSVIRLWSRSLIETDILRDEEVYNTFIVPRYGRFQRLSFPEKLHNHVYEKSLKIILDYQEPVQPDLPVDFFSVGIWVPRFPNPYWANFKTSEFFFFWKNLEDALIQTHIAAPSTKFQHKLYAHDDDQANFVQEERALSAHQQEYASLVEITPIDEDTSPE